MESRVSPTSSIMEYSNDIDVLKNPNRALVSILIPLALLTGLLVFGAKVIAAGSPNHMPLVDYNQLATATHPEDFSGRLVRVRGYAKYVAKQVRSVKKKQTLPWIPDQTQFVEVYVYDFTTAGGVISLESVIRVKDGPNEIIGQLHRDQKRWIVRAVSLPHFVKHLIAG